VLALSAGLAVAGAPAGVWFGRSGAMIVLPPAATRIDVALGPEGPTLHVARTVGSRLEVSATSSARDPFGLGVKVVLIENLVPLLIAGTAEWDRIGVESTLFFGPVRVDGGRVWGAGACRWASVSLSARPYLSMFFGLVVAADAEPFVGARVIPAGRALWEIGLSARRDGIRVSVGGGLW
jgi:hypothetical protein